MKKILILFVILFGLIFAVTFGKNLSKFNLPKNEKTPILKIGNHTFKLFVAKTTKEKEIGLSGKASLNQEYGMLFPFDKPDYYPFWMKDMKISIDMLFVENNKIVSVFKNLKPPKSKDETLEIIRPQKPADKVIEINSGLAEKYNIKPGDTVTIQE